MEKLKGFLLELIELVRNQYGAAVTAALSENVTKAEDLKDAYLDLITVIEHKFVLGDRENHHHEGTGRGPESGLLLSAGNRAPAYCIYFYPERRKMRCLLLRGVFERNLFQVELSKRSLTEFSICDDSNHQALAAEN